jgi:hypothetical protein
MPNRRLTVVSVNGPRSFFVRIFLAHKIFEIAARGDQQAYRIVAGAQQPLCVPKTSSGDIFEFAG